MPAADIHLVTTSIKHKYASHNNLYKEKLTRYKCATRTDITIAMWQLGNWLQMQLKPFPSKCGCIGTEATYFSSVPTETVDTQSYITIKVVHNWNTSHSWNASIQKYGRLRTAARYILQTKLITTLSRHVSQSYYIPTQNTEHYKNPVPKCIKSIHRLLRTSISSLMAMKVTKLSYLLPPLSYVSVIEYTFAKAN